MMRRARFWTTMGLALALTVAGCGGEEADDTANDADTASSEDGDATADEEDADDGDGADGDGTDSADSDDAADGPVNALDLDVEPSEGWTALHEGVEIPDVGPAMMVSGGGTTVQTEGGFCEGGERIDPDADEGQQQQAADRDLFNFRYVGGDEDAGNLEVRRTLGGRSGDERYEVNEQFTYSSLPDQARVNYRRMPGGELVGEVDEEFVHIDPTQNAATVVLEIDEPVGDIPAGEIEVGIRCEEDWIGSRMVVTETP